jgi:hypothetical protein
MEIKDVETRYDIDPLKEIFYKLKEKNDMYFALGLRKNITLEFFQFIKRQLDRNELINLNIAGRTRSSKSTDAGIIAMWIIDYLNSVGTYPKTFDIPYIFIFNISTFLNRFDEKAVKFHDIFIIDERKTFEAVQSGSMYEEGQIKDIDRIAAKKCIHRINIIGSYDDIDNNAFYSLVTYGKDYKNFTNKLIVYTREENEKVPLGYIEIPVHRFMCQDILNNVVTDCIACPLFSEENFKQFSKIPNQKYVKCNLYKAQYERLKDANIEATTEGGLEERTKIMIKLSYSFFKDKQFMSLKSKSQRKVYVQDNYYQYTNRRLTIDEISAICDRVDVIEGMEAKKKGLNMFDNDLISSKNDIESDGGDNGEDSTDKE